jgi:hypothetical protein
VGEAVNPRRAVRPAHDLGDARPVSDALDRVGQRGAGETICIGQNVADRATGEFVIVERQHDVGQQDSIALALDHPLGGGHRHTGALRYVLGFLFNVAAAHLRRLGREPVCFLGPQLVESGLLDDGERRAGGDGIQRDARDGYGAPTIAVLRQRRHQDWAALKDQTLRGAHHAIDDRALKQLPAGADHAPAHTRQPAAIVQDLQEAHGVGAILHHQINVDAV